MRIAVLGSGSWGTALARHFALKGLDVTLWGRDPSLEEYNKTHINRKYFPDVVLPFNLRFESSLEKALKDADLVLFSVPSKAYRNLAKEVSKYLTKKVHLLSSAKGFEENTLFRLSEVLREEIPSEKRYEIVSLLGPSYASEVIRDQLTAILAVSLDESEAVYIRSLISSNTLRVYSGNDEIGSECAAALKNVIAIGAGILVGLGQGQNAKAALVTRGIAESMRFGLAMGGKAETYLGLSGIGDLMLTCNSEKSRNFSLGYEIGKRDDASVLKEYNKTAEGVMSSLYISQLGEKLGVELPITDAIRAILFEGVKPLSAIEKLMERELKDEAE